MSYTPLKPQPYSPAPIEIKIGFGIGNKSKPKANWEREWKQRIEDREQRDPKTLIGWALKAFFK